jgi:hypothetical protein
MAGDTLLLYSDGTANVATVRSPARATPPDGLFAAALAILRQSYMLYKRLSTLLVM